MSTQQFRPNDSVDKRFYAPDRDIAYVGHRLLGRAVTLFDDELLTPCLREFIRASRLSEEQLCQAAIASANFINCVPRADVDSYSDALTESGLNNLPIAAYLALLLALGEVMLPVIFNAMRDVTPLSDPEISTSVDDLIRSAILEAEIAAIPLWKKLLGWFVPSSRRNAWLRKRVASRIGKTAEMFRWFKSEMQKEQSRVKEGQAADGCRDRGDAAQQGDPVHSDANASVDVGDDVGRRGVGKPPFDR